MCVCVCKKVLQALAGCKGERIGVMGAGGQKGLSLLSSTHCFAIPNWAVSLPSGTFITLLTQLQSNSSGVSLLSPLACETRSTSCPSNVCYQPGDYYLASSPCSFCH